MYSRFSRSVRGSDQDAKIYSGLLDRPRDYEANLEFTYVAQIVPDWTVQPDCQYVCHPNGAAGCDAKVMGVSSI